MRGSMIVCVVSLLLGCVRPGQPDPATTPPAPPQPPEPPPTSAAAATPSARAPATSLPEPITEPPATAEPVALPSQRTPDARLTGLTTVPRDLLITYAHEPCRGRCPVYHITIDAQGAVAFNGVDHVAVIGTAQRSIATAALISLLHRFGEMDFLGLDEATVQATCGPAKTDHATIIIKLTVLGRTTTVPDYQGCDDRHPLRASLAALEAEIERIAVDPAWLEPAKHTVQQTPL